MPLTKARAFRGCLLTKEDDQGTANYTTAAAVAWDKEDYDTDGFHEGVTNPSRITIPAGVTRVRLSAGVGVTALTADLAVLVSIRKANSIEYAGLAATSTESGAVYAYAQCSTPVITVAAADYFEVFLLIETDNSVTVESDQSWFAVEVIA